MGKLAGASGDGPTIDDKKMAVMAVRDGQTCAGDRSAVQADLQIADRCSLEHQSFISIQQLATFDSPYMYMYFIRVHVMFTCVSSCFPYIDSFTARDLR